MPANSVYGGRPADYIAETPESNAIIQKQKLINFYKNQFLLLKNSNWLKYIGVQNE